MMFVVPVHIRCLLLFVILIQTVSLNPINVSEYETNRYEYSFRSVFSIWMCQVYH